MQTECPHCHTVFQVSEEQLEQAEGQVRCGHCLAVFTADNPYQNPANLHDEIIEEQLSEDDIEESSQILPDVIPPDLRAETRSKNHHYSVAGTIFWSLAILLMIATGVLQYAYYERYNLVKHKELRPWLGLLCNYTKCDLPDPKNTQLIELSSKNIFTHPNTDNALMVSATIVNKASFEQDYPVLELKFENIRGELIAGRRFNPEEYLGIPTDQISKMEIGNPISFNIEIVDPGKEMVSYTFEFL